MKAIILWWKRSGSISAMPRCKTWSWWSLIFPIWVWSTKIFFRFQVSYQMVKSWFFGVLWDQHPGLCAWPGLWSRRGGAPPRISQGAWQSTLVVCFEHLSTDLAWAEMSFVSFQKAGTNPSIPVVMLIAANSHFSVGPTIRPFPVQSWTKISRENHFLSLLLFHSLFAELQKTYRMGCFLRCKI